MPIRTGDRLGRAAFEAYTHGLALDYPWGDLEEAERVAWCLAGEAVRVLVITEQNEVPTVPGVRRPTPSPFAAVHTILDEAKKPR
jgi:hypothetical protein